MRIFLTHIASRDLAKMLDISMAATNFSLNLIKNNLFNYSFSVLPPFVVNQKKSEIISLKNLLIEYNNLRNTQFSKLAPIIEQLNILRKIPNNSNLWLYNITPLNAYLTRLLRFFKPSVKIFCIVLDYTPNDPKSTRFLPLINACDGRILLSKSNLFNPHNSICLPGVTPIEDISYPTIDEISFDFLISGQLNDKISMLTSLLQVFSKIPNAKLHITGKAPKLAYEYAQQFKNIVCYGEVDYENFLEILHSTPFLLSTRDPEMPENECNFPSKIIEGLLHNRIILSTIDYPQLGDIKYIKLDVQNLYDSIIKVINTPKEELMQYANQSELTQKSFNTEVWSKAMEEIENNVKKER